MRPGGPRSGPSSLPSLEAGVPRPTRRPPSLPPSWVAARPSWSSLGGWALLAGLPSPGHPKQVTLSTLSRPRFGLAHFYLRVRRGKEGKKIQRRSKSIGRKNLERVSTEAEKAQALPTFKLQQSFQENAETGLPTRTSPETRTPQPHCSSFRQKGLQLHHQEAPFLLLGSCRGCSWHSTGGDCPPPSS
ncbi:hypothetical protein EGM_06405 [Macaca fascicularis]|uniref:Uncharacterized protein n=1 Tax=Macaca fascicularis TaxID=9541 RepID=G7PPN9_MACFA|nr:hypothetical protein EGM_06405 [Macaca fascicularis]